MYIKKNDVKKIKVIFYTKEQIIKECWFQINSSLKDIFNYFEKHIKGEGYSLKTNYKIFGKEINESIQIADLIKKEKNNKILEGEIWIEIEEEIILEDENEETFFTILQPKLNPFELIEYNSLKSKIAILSCSKDILFNSNLNKFTKESAFCNSINSLYMSGGEIYGKAINNFWIINKHNYKINKKNMPICKKYHSMIYIPDNYIFIAGGDSLNTIIYDIDNQEFINWANMNKKHFQPGLCTIGDYVYAFSSLNDINRNNNYFEKTNLTFKEPKWEIIFPKFNNNVKMNCHFFGISKLSDGKILILGGEKNNPIYSYNPSGNTITILNGRNSSIPFWDKSFYKISKYYNICIPLNFSINNKLIVLEKETVNLKEIIYDKKSGLVNFSLKKNDKVGNLYIQSTIRDIRKNENIIIKIGTNPKNEIKKYKNEKNNKDNVGNDKEETVQYNKNNNIKLNEEEIIINEYYDNKINKENQNNSKLNKSYKNKNHFYIPNSYVDEQIINREINLNEINNNEKFNNNENINQEKLIITDNSERINKIENNNSKVSKRKEHLYIPNSIINEQIINRELILNNNNFNNNSEKENQNEGKIILKFENKFEPEKDNYKISQNKNKFLYIPKSSIDAQIICRNIEINDKDSPNKYKLEMPKNDDDNLSDKILEEKEIINYLDNAKENNEPKIKNYYKQAKIYLPENLIEEAIIKRDILPDKNHNNIGEDILKENEIINYISEGKKNESKIKNYNNKNKIYIPENAIEEQIIKREIISKNENDENNLKEREIINFSQINTDKNELKKTPHKEEKIYIPKYIIEEQIMNREVVSDRGKTFENGENNSENDIINEIIYLDGENEKNENKIKIYQKRNKIYLPKYIIEDQIINREFIPNI